MDKLGRVIHETACDDYQTRIGVSHVLVTISPELMESSIPNLFDFYVSIALGDENEEVRKTVVVSCC